MVHSLFQIMTWMGSEWVLLVLLSLSVLTAAVIFSRWSELSKLLKSSDRFWEEHAEQWFQTADTKSWRGELEELKVTYPCLEVETLDLLDRAPADSDLDQMIDAFLDRKKMKLEKSISILGTIGSNGPFVGLLGTVLGIIKAFHDIGGGSGGMETISGGISEALVATAVGLLVAIPAVVFFNVLNKRISTIVRRAASIGSFLRGRKTEVEGARREATSRA